MGNSSNCCYRDFIGGWHLPGLLVEWIDMTFIAYVVAFVAILGAFTYFCIPRGSYRGAGTAVFVILAGGAFSLSFEAAGQPKPLEIEWRQMSQLRVVGFFPNEEKQLVYLWVIRDGIPTSYAFPWPNDGDVEQLQDKWRKRGETGDEFFLADGAGDIADVKPEPQMPPKDLEQ